MSDKSEKYIESIDCKNIQYILKNGRIIKLSDILEGYASSLQSENERLTLIAEELRQFRAKDHQHHLTVIEDLDKAEKRINQLESENKRLKSEKATLISELAIKQGELIPTKNIAPKTNPQE